MIPMSPYIGVGLMVVLSTAVALIIVLLGIVLGPRKPTDRKLAPYESGVQPVGDAMQRLPGLPSRPPRNAGFAADAPSRPSPAPGPSPDWQRAPA